eukprot:jgi/Hompol1/2073/HPOL_002814-RA
MKSVLSAVLVATLALLAPLQVLAESPNVAVAGEVANYLITLKEGVPDDKMDDIIARVEKAGGAMPSRAVSAFESLGLVDIELDGVVHTQ